MCQVQGISVSRWITWISVKQSEIQSGDPVQREGFSHYSRDLDTTLTNSLLLTLNQVLFVDATWVK